jgi:hypothetical protein
MMKLLTGTVMSLGLFLVGAGDLSAQKKTDNCCTAKLACCSKPSACCVAQARLGCCEQGMKCCADNRGCCAAVQSCCTTGAECCKQDKACCGPKSEAKLDVAKSGCCTVAEAKKPACCDAGHARQ